MLIIDALRPLAHSTHMSLEEALETAKKLAPARTLLTHMTHELDFVDASASLPPTCELAHDGLTLNFL